MAVEVKVIKSCGSSVIVESIRQYPYIGVAKTGNAVLFTRKDTGTTIVASKNSKLGTYLEQGWDESYFTPLSPSESITLRNV